MPKALRGTAVFLFLISRGYGSPQAAEDASAKIGLTVPAGTPLRLYTTKRFSKRKGTAVTAKVLEPVYAFDQQTIPAGTLVAGSVSRTHPVRKWERAQALLRGDFTPLRISEVEFHSLLLPDGRTLAVRTAETEGLNSIYEEPKKKKPKKQPQSANGGVLGTARQTLQDRINAQVNGRSQGVAAILRSPDRKERLYDFAMAKLPYHPQYVRRGTRFDAELTREHLLRHGIDYAGIGRPVGNPAAARQRGFRPAPHAGRFGFREAGRGGPGRAHGTAVCARPQAGPARGDADERRRGDDASGAMVSPERPASVQLFGRGTAAGRRRAAVRPAGRRSTRKPCSQRRKAAGRHPSRSIRKAPSRPPSRSPGCWLPFWSAIVASRAADNDAGKVSAGAASHAAGGGVGRRVLGGGLGFGLLGTAIAQSSRYVGVAFGYYGLAWSIYNNVIAKGAEVYFEKNAVMEVKFGGRPAPAGGKFVPKENPK